MPLQFGNCSYLDVDVDVPDNVLAELAEIPDDPLEFPSGHPGDAGVVSLCYPEVLLVQVQQLHVPGRGGLLLLVHVGRLCQLDVADTDALLKD